MRHPSFVGLREDKPAKDVVREMPQHVEKIAKPKRKAAPAKRRAGAMADDFGIEISNPDRVIYPREKLTKGDLANYYAQIESLIMIDAAQRPMTVIRFPQGTAGKGFFQKHDTGTFGPHVKHIPIEEKDGEMEDYLYVDDIRGLLACVQMGTVEFHGWGSKTGKVEFPDRLVFDLDPDEGLDFGQVKEAALLVGGAEAQRLHARTQE